MNRDTLANDILLTLLRIADPDHIDPEHLAACAVLTADALIKRLCQPQPQPK
jgi:hypothetical protein